MAAARAPLYVEARRRLTFWLRSLASLIRSSFCALMLRFFSATLSARCSSKRSRVALLSALNALNFSFPVRERLQVLRRLISDRVERVVLNKLSPLSELKLKIEDVPLALFSQRSLVLRRSR